MGSIAARDVGSYPNPNDVSHLDAAVITAFPLANVPLRIDTSRGIPRSCWVATSLSVT
jgi:hypothetical protein